MTAGNLGGKVALVTGGARGLGAALCGTLAAAGATVIVADLQLEAAQIAAHGLIELGHPAWALGFDVSVADEANTALQKIADRYGRLDVLINNAGTDVTEPLEGLSIGDWQRVLGTNLHGPFYLCKYAVPLLRRSGQGHIVNICSTAAKRAWPRAAAYHASKWGLLGLSHALHAELRSEGIRVTAVIAGGMRTAFLLDRFPDLDEARLQDPVDVARTVLFVLTAAGASVVPEITVLPLQESSWP